jgi:hypothetical protein
MSSDPINRIVAASSERRPAVWPWLLVPLLALALFLALKSFKEARLPATQSDTEAPATQAPASTADPS